MAHKIYPNLAHLDDFPSDLNYTGIVCDGWDHPINIIPLLVALVCFIFGGKPQGLLSVWVLINAALIHMWMDGLIGPTGLGPKYLTDEYAILDSRFWPTKDPSVMIISFLELLVFGPLCICWYIAIAKNSWCRHFFCLVVSTFQIMGTILFVVCEILDDFKHLPAKTFNALAARLTATEVHLKFIIVITINLMETWPPKFDSYMKLKYFWFIFVFCNSFWLLVPLILYWSTWQQMKPSKEKRP